MTAAARLKGEAGKVEAPLLSDRGEARVSSISRAPSQRKANFQFRLLPPRTSSSAESSSQRLRCSLHRRFCRERLARSGRSRRLAFFFEAFYFWLRGAATARFLPRLLTRGDDDVFVFGLLMRGCGRGWVALEKGHVEV